MRASKMIGEVLAELLLVLALLQAGLAREEEPQTPILDSTEDTSEIASSGSLYISKESPYCDWNKTMGPLCIYSGTDRVVVVPEGLTLPSGKLELEIRGAKTVHVKPACIPWIVVKNAGLVTTIPHKQRDSRNLNHKVCRTWLRIQNSRADTISSGVRDFSIKDTWVNTIRLVQQKGFAAKSSTIVSIEALSWDGFLSEILNTTIQSISQMVAGGDWMVTDSHFGSIAASGISFKASEMDITDSSISYISPKGIRIMSGTVTFTNVIINRLESFAIVVENPAAFLNLYNVTIVSALENCIVLPDRGRIFIKNVTIEGIRHDLSSPYFKFVDDYVMPWNVKKIQAKEKMELCFPVTSAISTLICDFSSIDEIIELNAADTEGYDHVRIRNAKSLEVLSIGCNIKLELHSVNGSLPHLDTTNNVGINTTSGENARAAEKCDVSLSFLNCKLGVIYAKYITKMNITNSTVERLHEGTLRTFNLENFTVDTLDSINISGAGSRWTKLKLGIVLNVTFQAPVKAEDIIISSKLRKGAMIINHAHATTELSKLRVSIMQRESVVVRRGTLLMKELRFSELLEGAIHVEEGATLEIDKIIGMPDYASISVATRDQVVLKGMSSWYAERMIHVRHHPPPPDVGSNLTISNVHNSPYCRKFNITFSYRECDFSHVQNASVIIDLEGTEQTYQTVEIRNASFVKLYPSCIRKLYLVKVTEATTVDNDKDCETWLEADGVNFKKISAGVHDVTLTSCRVELFSPYRMLKDLDLENTHIEQVAGVHWYGYMGVFNSSYFGSIKGLVASSFIFILNTTMVNVLPQGITVLADGLIVNSSISSVATGGITVEGGLRIANVSIGSLAKKAILVKDGVLVLSNVTIGTSDGESIMATMNGAVAMQNVTVAGKKVHWRGYITDSLGPDDPSLVFVNKYVDDQQRVSTVPVPVLDDSSNTKTPQQSSAIELPAPENNEIENNLSSERMGSREVSPSSTPWKWVGVSLSVFMVILLGCCIVLAVTLVKTNSGRMLPVVFWRVMDDQNGLVSEDQPSSNVTGSSRHSGYHPMPATYNM